MSEHSPGTTSNDTDGPPSEPTRFFDKPGNVKRALVVLYVVCAAALGLDFVVDRHIAHPWEGLFGFHALYGFAVCVTLVLVAKQLRKILMRSEIYYDGEDNG